ncbi:LmbE family N-acetylglucosaminyl deacetylase [Mucilaginibacter gracilis]|uniref:LmbE family N-acetylglucosaminyl deacetylase n=1 Tax=Mucilaginibacter gracilis TaxID=423350 RepID=A0A495IUJ1_9SPHI|nr:PIG-L family deacetylase [Mucilaginibacter gracilis]RKR80415.1 LmbE family N-acetylglucosaminyl deacetylase [Mucilaginibacter gracilis]
MLRYYLFCYLFCAALAVQASAQHKTGAPRILVVMAHPDDESILSVTLYKIAREQHGTVDLFIITNGEAGYKYSVLAEQYYGVPLTVEKVGRELLPGIRKKELRNAGHILGVSGYYYQDQPDSHYGLSEKEPLDTSWNTNVVSQRLNELLKKNSYDFVFCILPEPDTHGQHKAASILALKAITSLPAGNRPVILGARTRNKTDTVCHFQQYSDYKDTKADLRVFQVDRTATLGFKNRLNYKVIANWEIAEHKSQGATQMTMNEGDLEEFWYFTLNGEAGLAKTSQLFNSLKRTPEVN